MKVRVLLLFALLLSGCATAPPEIPMSAIDRNAAVRHQDALRSFNDWSLSGQIALFNLTADERDAVYLEWHNSPTQMRLRFYHPLKGTLARLEQDVTGATYFDENGQAYYGRTAELLVARLFNYQLPLELLREVITGRQPDNAAQFSYQLHDVNQQSYAPLSSYVVHTDEQSWQVDLSGYDVEQHYLLPHQVELLSATWRIKLKVSQWKL